MRTTTPSTASRMELAARLRVAGDELYAAADELEAGAAQTNVKVVDQDDVETLADYRL